jgi:hypothetical protein
LSNFYVIAIVILSGKAISYMVKRLLSILRVLAMAVKPEINKKEAL